MGKYSLESYEKYKTYKLRPEPLAKNPINTGCDIYKIVTVHWSSLEPHKADYQFQNIKDEINQTTLLIIEESPPNWASDNKEYLSAFIRKLGSEFDGNPSIIGVLMENTDRNETVLQAYLDAFSETHLIVRLEDHWQILYLQKIGAKFGLLVSADSSNRLDCCEMFARYHLQHTWEKAPVLIHFTQDSLMKSFYKDALRWHVCAANISMGLGYNFTLRRLTYPKQVSSSGAMPLRFWFVNTGTSLCYYEIELRIRLGVNTQNWILHFRTNGNHWSLGDIIENEIATLPDLKAGDYQLSVGLFYKNNPLLLDIDAPVQSGFYQIGRVKVDTKNRDELYHIWDTYYPEGYYPLEDPQEPEQSEDLE